MLPTALFLMFIGGAGKSAMFPLHIWLPDAMEGPTPVSALIHAATMVVAGVFQIARLFPLWIEYAPGTLHIVAWVGAFTAFYAAAVACCQSDIKRVLAFSTISQIAFMMVALGVCTEFTTSLLRFLLKGRNPDSSLCLHARHGLDHDSHCRHDSLLHVPFVLRHILGHREQSPAC